MTSAGPKSAGNWLLDLSETVVERIESEKTDDSVHCGKLESGRGTGESRSLKFEELVVPHALALEDTSWSLLPSSISQTANQSDPKTAVLPIFPFI